MTISVHRRSIVSNARSPQSAQVAEPAHPHPYRADGTGLVLDKVTKSGVVPTPLTNFDVRIIADTLIDNGVDTSRRFEMEARQGDRSHDFSVPADQFSSMGWVLSELGAGAVVYPGVARGHACTAIQMLSDTRVERRIFTHTGWRNVDDHGDIFLHAGGALGAKGLVPEVAVEIEGPLGSFCLPEPPRGRKLVEVIRDCEEMLRDLAPPEVIEVLRGGVYRAVLGRTPDFALNVCGTTGLGKSELAALAQQHFGPEMNRLNLPANWSSTANSLEELAFLAKDVVLVIDDFAPEGTRYDSDKLHGAAARLFRATGNQSGRGRMNSNISLRDPHPPRGLIVSTGEEPLRGHSLNARVLTVELHQAVDWEGLSVAQEAAASGNFASAMAGFISHIAENYTAALGTFHERRQELLRIALTSNAYVHQRTPEMVADLGAAWSMWLDFSLEVGAVSSGERDRQWNRVWTALQRQGANQVEQIAQADPVERYLDGLSSLLSTRKAHLARVSGGEDDGELLLDSEWGDGDGELLGYVADDGIFLDRSASLSAVQRMLGPAGEPLGISVRALAKQLDEKGYLATTGKEEAGRQSYLVRRTFTGRRASWLHLRLDVLGSSEPDHPDQGGGE